MAGSHTLQGVCGSVWIFNKDLRKHLHSSWAESAELHPAGPRSSRSKSSLGAVSFSRGLPGCLDFPEVESGFGHTWNSTHLARRQGRSYMC